MKQRMQLVSLLPSSLDESVSEALAMKQRMQHPAFHRLRIKFKVVREALAMKQRMQHQIWNENKNNINFPG